MKAELVAHQIDQFTKIEDDIILIQNYARIQIEKDRENSKLLLKQHLQTHVAGYTPCCIEVFKNRPIILD